MAREGNGRDNAGTALCEDSRWWGSGPGSGGRTCEAVRWAEGLILNCWTIGVLEKWEEAVGADRVGALTAPAASPGLTDHLLSPSHCFMEVSAIFK